MPIPPDTRSAGDTGHITDHNQISDELTTLAAGVAASLPLAGGTMTGAIAMGSHKVTGLTNGSSAQDAAAWGQTPAGGHRRHRQRRHRADHRSGCYRRARRSPGGQRRQGNRQHQQQRIRLRDAEPG